MPPGHGEAAPRGSAQDRGLLRRCEGAARLGRGGGAACGSGSRLHEPQHPGGSRAGPRPLGPAAGRNRAGIVAARAGWRRDGRLTNAHGAALELGSLQELNGLPAPLREGLYGRLIPAEVCARFGVDPRTGFNGAGHRLLRIFAPPEQSWARVELRASRDDRDPIVLVDGEVGPFGVPELSFVQITDPDSPRFGIDRDDDGQDTLFGTVGRNLSEERRAAAAGLAPGQVRPGLRLLGRVLDAMEDFCRLFGK